jgi:hypothetical protein
MRGTEVVHCYHETEQDGGTMTAENFCYWLQGYIELQNADKRERPAGLTEEQRVTISNHLNLVFIHDIDVPNPTGELQAAHDGKPNKPPKWSNRPGARC